MTAARVIEFPQPRAPAAAPVNKLRVLERVRYLICQGEVRRSAMNVVQYIAEITDKETGLAIAELNTIADRTCYSRGEVGRALKELVECGVVERMPRRKGKRCLAAAFRLLDVSAQMRRPRLTEETTPSHAGDTYAGGLQPLPHGLSPNGLVPATERVTPAPRSGPSPAHQDDEATDAPDEALKDWAGWLAREGRYKRWGPGGGEAYRLAKADLDNWRSEKGDRAILGALERAKALGLSGDNLIDYLRNSYPSNRRTAP